jgi:hypothetical protein
MVPTALIGMVLAVLIGIWIVGGLGYDVLRWGPNQPPEWLGVTTGWGLQGTVLAITLVVGWRIWRHRA